MIVHWEVEDGYVGKSRPQSTEISNEDLDACETQAERDLLIEECIQEDFEQSITWAIVSMDE
jgi:hypothetical protein